MAISTGILHKTASAPSIRRHHGSAVGWLTAGAPTGARTCGVPAPTVAVGVVRMATAAPGSVAVGVGVAGGGTSSWIATVGGGGVSVGGSGVAVGRKGVSVGGGGVGEEMGVSVGIEVGEGGGR